MTKKQITALNRILARERLRRADEPCGIHPAGNRYIVTDGVAAILLRDKPEGFPEADRQDTVYKSIQNDREYGDHVLAFTATADMVKNWKQMAREWQGGKSVKDGAPPVEITAQREDGAKVSGFFNPLLLVDAAEAVGTGCMVYIGHNTRLNSYWPTLLIYPKDWMGTAPKITGFVLPLRI